MYQCTHKYPLNQPQTLSLRVLLIHVDFKKLIPPDMISLVLLVSTHVRQYILTVLKQSPLRTSGVSETFSTTTPRGRSFVMNRCRLLTRVDLGPMTAFSCMM